jgi:hypothetical protein
MDDSQTLLLLAENSQMTRTRDTGREPIPFFKFWGEMKVAMEVTSPEEKVAFV